MTTVRYLGCWGCREVRSRLRSYAAYGHVETKQENKRVGTEWQHPCDSPRREGRAVSRDELPALRSRFHKVLRQLFLRKTEVTCPWFKVEFVNRSKNAPLLPSGRGIHPARGVHVMFDPFLRKNVGRLHRLLPCVKPGEIPSNLGELVALEELDLHSNHLEGECVLHILYVSPEAICSPHGL